MFLLPETGTLWVRAVPALAVLAAASVTAAAHRAWLLQIVVVWSAFAVGASLQMRLGEGANKISALALVSAAVLLTCSKFTHVATTLPAGWAPKVAFAATLTAFVARGPAMVLPGASLDSGLLPLGPVSVQVGEYTRLMALAGFALAAHTWATWPRHELRRERAWLIGAVGAFAAHYLLLVVKDTGPAVITTAGVLVIAATLSPSLRVKRSEVLLWGGLSALVALGVARLLWNLPVAQAMVERMSHRFAIVGGGSYQGDIAQAAMAEGGALGRGMGSSSLAASIPVADSDFAPAALAADLGLIPVVCLAAALVWALGTMGGRSWRRLEATSLVAVGIAAAALIQTFWPVIGALGIGPMSGLSTPWLVVTGSAVTSTAAATGVLLATADRGGSQPLNGGRTTAYTAAVSAVAAMLVVAGIAKAATIEAPQGIGGVWHEARGDIVTRDGVVLATGPSSDRTYPYGERAASITGVIWKGYSESGVEKAASAHLTCGAPPTLGDRLAWVVRPLPCHPADAVTTIDTRWQDALIGSFTELRGAGLIVDSQTGQVLAAHDTTMTDPSSWTLGKVPDSLLSDRPSAPGSVMKPLVVAAAASSGVDLSGPSGLLTLNHETLRNAGSASCVDSSPQGALAQSCNTVIGAIGVRMGARALQQSLSTTFGADATLEVDGHAVEALHTGLGPTTSGMAVARTAIGQEGAQATPMAIAAAYTSLVRASTGLGDTPLTMLAPCTPDDADTAGEPTIQPWAAKIALSGMARAVTDTTGTARALQRAAADTGLEIMAKTSTSAVPKSFSDTGTSRWAVTIVAQRYLQVVLVVDDHTTDTSNPALDVTARMLPAMTTVPDPILSGACQ